jgi:hypothetical protein
MRTISQLSLEQKLQGLIILVIGIAALITYLL